MQQKEIQINENLDIATGEQKEKIVQISELDIGANTKAELVMVILGLMDATEIDVYKWNDDAKKISTILDIAGLLVRERKVSSENKNLITTLVVAKTIEMLEKFINLDPSVDHVEYGRMMGFPDTAIEAFGDGEKLLPEGEYPEDFDHIAILPFKLSKVGRNEEVRQLKYRTALVEKYAPDVYADLMGLTA